MPTYFICKYRPKTVKSLFRLLNELQLKAADIIKKDVKVF